MQLMFDWTGGLLMINYKENHIFQEWCEAEKH